MKTYVEWLEDFRKKIYEGYEKHRMDKRLAGHVCEVKKPARKLLKLSGPVMVYGVPESGELPPSVVVGTQDVTPSNVGFPIDMRDWAEDPSRRNMDTFMTKKGKEVAENETRVIIKGMIDNVGYSFNAERKGELSKTDIRKAEDWLKEHVNKKLLRLKKYFDKPIEVKVILSVEKFRNVAEINLLAKGLNLNGKEEAKDMIVAIDNVIDKIERQLKKHKEKIRNRKENAIKSETATMNELSSESYQEDEDQPKIVEVRKIVLKPMSIDDAIMQLEESRNRFVVYRDSSSEKMNVIYKSDDGNYGLIEVKS